MVGLCMEDLVATDTLVTNLQVGKDGQVVTGPTSSMRKLGVPGLS